METKNLKIKELSKKEAGEIDGGIIGKLIFAAVCYYAWEVATNPQAHAAAWKRGWDAAAVNKD